MPKLTKKEIKEFEKIRGERAFSYDNLRDAMGARFSSQTVINALKGRPVYATTYFVLIEYLKRSRNHTNAADSNEGGKI